MKLSQFFPIAGILVLQPVVSCNGQTQTPGQIPGQTPGQTMRTSSGRVGGECEAGYCELLYYGMPKQIDAVDTSAGWFEPGQKLVVSGRVYQLDGKTPAPNVIVYYHQTDHNGYYSPGKDPESKTRHGHIRGWMSTDENGNYTLYTNRPAPYPNAQAPPHIHLMIKEPDIANEYWINDIMFEDDPLLRVQLKNNPSMFNEGRGGRGIVQATAKDGVQTAEYNITLGLNVPNYPAAKPREKEE